MTLGSRSTLIDATRIETELAQNIAELIRYEPGIDVVEQGSRFGLSGITIRGIGGNRVHIEVDGVATSDAFSIGSFSNASRDFFDIDSLKQVEIIRGPASAVFGSDALGGVVSFVTKSPSDVLRDSDRYANASIGFNTVDASQVLSGSYAARLGSVSAMFRGTYREGQERDVPAADPLDDRNLNLLAKFDLGNTESGGVSVTLEHFDSDSLTAVDSLEGTQDFTSLFGFPYVVDTTRIDADDSRTRRRISVGQEWVTGKFGTDYLRWRAYWQDSETRQDTFEDRDTLIAGVPGAITRERQFKFEQTLSGIEINAGSDMTWGDVTHELSYGVEYETADTRQLRSGLESDLTTGESSNQVGPDTFPLRDFPLSSTTRMGVYLQNRIALGRITLTPGLRWDRFELAADNDPIFAADNPGITPRSIDDDQLSPKLGATFNIDDQWQVYAQYAEGFRAPPVNDVNIGFTNFQFGYTALPNPDLRSESSVGYEVGARLNGDNSHVEFAMFRTQFDDFIQSLQVVDFDPINRLLVFQSINVDEVTIEGAEISTTWSPRRFSDSIQFNLSAAYARGTNEITNRPVDTVAPFNAVLGIDYKPTDDRWGFSGIARGATRQTDLDESDGARFSPSGYIVFDATAFFQASPKVRLRAGVYNIGNTEYTPYLDVQGLPADAVN
ncbi:MAG: TonB-dependent hemoglobin/transferrin/lactoferrin family receptor, partial [Pseudomonadota bacterium]